MPIYLPQIFAWRLSFSRIWGLPSSPKLQGNTMQKRSNFIAIAVMTLLVFSSPTNAQEYWVGFDAVEYNADLDETIDVMVLLFEDVSDGSTSRLAPGADDGLFSFSASVAFSSTDGDGATFDSFSLHPFFMTGFPGSGEDLTVTDASVSFEGSEDFANNDADGEIGVGGFQLDANLWAIELGTISFVPGAPSSVTTIVAGPHPHPLANDLLFGDAFSLGGGGWSTGDSASGEIRINAVPEPTSLGLIGFCLLGVTGRRRTG